MKEGRGRAVAVALDAVAGDAVTLVDLLAAGDRLVRARQVDPGPVYLLRLEQLAPHAAVRAELLDVRGQRLDFPGLGH
jgi:hypothetical protein